MITKIEIGAEARSLCIVFLLTLLCVAAALGYRSENSRYGDHIERLSEINRRTLALNDLLSTLQDAETGQRGFVITGRPEYLDPYEAALSRIERTFRRLEREYEQSPGSKAELSSLRQLASAKLAELVESIRARRSGGFAAAQAVVAGDAGKHLMDQMRLLIDRMLQAERISIEYETAISQEQANKAGAGIAALAAISLLIVLVMIHLSVSEAQNVRRLNRKLAFASNHDPLTGLANRRAFMEAVDRTIKEADRRGDPPGIIFIDLDRFKPVNDEFGHAVGDRVLIEIAKVLREVVRSSDLVARLGGDEFAILLQHMPQEHDLAEMRNRFEDAVSRIDVPALRGRGVSASMGTARYGTSCASGAELLAAADRAMYDDKALLNRRNLERLAGAHLQRACG